MRLDPYGKCPHCGLQKFSGHSLSSHIAACPRNPYNWRLRQKAAREAWIAKHSYTVTMKDGEWRMK